MDRLNRFVFRRQPLRSGGIVNALHPSAWYRYGAGITVTGAGVSQWNDASGNGNHLLQGTDAARPPLQADNSILFDGVAQFLAATFTLNQPCTFYMLVKQMSWSASDCLGGGSVGSVQIFQSVATPGIALFAGSIVGQNGNLAVGSYGALAAVFNGAGSMLQINQTAASAGDAGATNPGGLFLARNLGGANFANIQVKEVIVFTSAHNAATVSQVNAYLQQLGGI